MNKRAWLRTTADLSLAVYCLLLFSPVDQWADLSVSKAAWLLAIVTGYPLLYADRIVDMKQERSRRYYPPQFAIAGLIMLPLFRFIVVKDDQSFWNLNWHTLLFVMILMPLFFNLRDSSKRVCVSAVGLGLVVTCVALFHSYFSLGEISEISGRPLYLAGGRDVNFLATALCSAFPLLIINAEQSLRLNPMQRNWARFSQAAIIVAGILFGASIVLSESRTGAICFAITLVLLAASVSKPIKILKYGFIFILIASSLYAFTFGGLIERLADAADQSSSDRINSYYAAFKSFSESPIFGVGFDGAAENYYRFSGFGAFESLNPKLVPHNFIAQIGAEFGVFGLGILCLIVATSAKLLRTSPAAPPVPNRNMILISLFALGLSGLAMPIAYLDWAYMILILCLSMATPNPA